MVRPMFGKVETLGPWTAHIQAMDQALQSNDPGESVRALFTRLGSVACRFV